MASYHGDISNYWEKGTGLPDRGPEEINTMGVCSLHAFDDLLKQKSYDDQVYSLKQPLRPRLSKEERIFSSFWEASEIHSDKLWWREMEQNIQRELIAKSFKKPVKITLKFIFIVTYCPQSTK